MSTATNLTPIQLQVAAALASGVTTTRIADQLQLSRQTIYTWRKSQPAFEQAVTTAATEYAQTIRDALQEQTASAINVLGELMRDANTPPNVRARIALAILNRPHFPNPGWHTPVPIQTDPVKARTAQILEEMEAHLKAAQMQRHLMQLTTVQATADANAQAAPLTEMDETGQETSAATEPPLDETGQKSATQCPRSAPCPCGSSLKYKRCCGRNAPPFLTKKAA